ncbi:cohesin loading factor-domain-containing protein [Thermoascus aurantiacus ATCC 26904]
MSYPPPHNGQYPPQYLQQPQHHQPHPQPSQYNVSPNAPYPQYGKPMLYPQVLIPAYPAYGQQHQQPQYHHQQQQQQQQPLPRQYVSPPSTSFQPQAPPSHYVHGHPSPTPQYGGRAATSPAVPVTGHAPSPALPPSPYYSISSPSMPNAYGQYPAAAQVSSPTRPQPRPATQPQPASSAASPASAPAPQQIPQVVIPARPPASSPEVPQKMPAKAPAKKQLQRLQSQPSVEKESKPPIDYQVLLLALADEYFNAAHSKGTMVALQRREMEMEEYYKLVATGLGCLEAVLKNWRLQPRTEALVRLRYARILFEETDNDIEAETALSKGIDLCDRNRMLDLKYSMQQLLARLLHKSNPKAAMKAVDGMIQDVEAYRHIAWEYAFRLLRVTLSLSSSSHQDFVAALHNLHRISNLANRNRDKAVSVISAVTEALAHLQQSTSSDSIEQAQRALAIARSHQLDDEVRDIPQISTLIQMVDISCSLLEYDINQSAQKLQIMQTLMDQKINDPHWRDDGSFSIPLNGKSVGPSSADTGDILQVENGTLVLTLNWLPQHDLYALCYFLSSVTMSAKNSHDGRKAEKYLEEGLRMIRGSFKAPQEIAESLVTAGKRIEWRRILYCNMLLQRIFLTASRTDWEQASQALKELRQAAKELGDNLPDTIQCLMEYAAGTIAQGTGDLTGALSAFQSPILRLSSSASKTSRNDPRRDTAILAALNTVLILRDPKHPMHSQLPSILSTVESFCKGSPNKYIQAAYYLVCATVQTDSTIQTKQYLQQALQSATAISNSQITCMTLTFMSWKYFRGVVGEQSEKSARAGRAMAKRANDRLWVSVTDEMLAETLERQGKGEEARSVREEGRRVMMGLPPALKKAEVN